METENTNNKARTNETQKAEKTGPNISIKNKKRLPRLYLHFIYFLVFAIIGWLIETAYGFYELGHFTKRGFLYGPLCPIYGWGAIILIMFFSTYKKKNFKLFIYAAVIFSLFEYLVGFGLEALFSLRLWD